MATHDRPRVWHDFQASTPEGLLVLTLRGTLESLESQGIELREGLELELWCDDETLEGERDDLVARVTIERDREYDGWLARMDERGIVHELGVRDA